MIASPQVAKTRDIRFDIMRAVAILGVVFIHAGALFQKGEASRSAGLAENYFRWAVPLFLLLSAFMSARSLAKRSEGYGEFIKRRWPPLLLSFVLFSCLYLVLFGGLKHLTPSKLITQYFLGRGWSGQYFFLVLLQLLLFYPLLAKWRLSNAAMVVTLIVTMVGYLGLGIFASQHAVLSKIGDIPFFYWLVYPVFGFYLYQQNGLYEKLSALPPLLCRVLWFAVPLAIPLSVLLFPHLPMISPYINPILPLVSVVMMALTPAAFSGLDSSFWQNIAMVGQYSLGVFCLNPLLIFGLPKLARSEGFIPHYGGAVDLIVRLVASVVAVALTYGMSRGIEKVGGKALVR